MKNPKIVVSFEHRILLVKYLENAIITDEDLKEIYSLAEVKAKWKPYCIMFEALNHYEVTEDAITYLSNNPHNKNILAKAYVINTKEAELKTKFHFLFDNPALKPYTFKNSEDAKKYLVDVINKSIP